MIYLGPRDFYTSREWLARLNIEPYLDGAVLREDYDPDKSAPQPYRLSRIVVNSGGHWIIYFYHDHQWYCSNDMDPKIRRASMDEIKMDAVSVELMYEKIPQEEEMPDKMKREMADGCRATRAQWDAYASAQQEILPPEFRS